MTKTDIAKHIHEKAEVSEAEAADLLEHVLNILTSALRQGEPVVVAGFGKFMVRSKASRPGRNPRTGEPIVITGRNVVSFHASPLWKAELNEAG
jgi:integration host factor subunit alpha